MKQALTKEKSLKAKHHEDLLSVISTLMAKFVLPLPLPNFFLLPVYNIVVLFETLGCAYD